MLLGHETTTNKFVKASSQLDEPSHKAVLVNVNFSATNRALAQRCFISSLTLLSGHAPRCEYKFMEATNGFK